MPSNFSAELARFTSPHDVEHLRALEEAAASIKSTALTAEEIRAVFALYERFPDEDGYGIFWSLLHAVEASKGYEHYLLASINRKPVEFNIAMVGRLIIGGISQIAGHELPALLKAVIAQTEISPRARETAIGFLSHQCAL